MLQFHRARFSNFVVLRDVELQFSTDTQRSTTVVRAENGSGKTTCLRALEWTLYGDRALPTHGKYELQPLDWTPADGAVEVAAEVEFTVRQANRKPGGTTETISERYTLMRKAEVRPDASGSAVRFTQPSPVLLRHDEAGHAPIQNPQSLIDGWLPLSLREFFFTDGDQALAYISADESSARRSRVEGAVQSLLGLSLVESASARIQGRTARDLRKRAAKESGEASLEQLTDQLEALETQVDAKKAEREERLADVAHHESDYAEISADRDKALERGNKEVLKNDLQRIEGTRKAVRSQRLEAQREVSRLLRDPALETGILLDRVEAVRELLEPLQQTGRIPATHVPFLRDRIKSGTCVCGADLVSNPEARAHVQHLIEQSEAGSDAAKRLSEIYTETGQLARSVRQPTRHWPTLFARAFEREDKLREQDEDLGRQAAHLENTIAALPDTDIQALTRRLELTRDALGKSKTVLAMLEREIGALDEELEKLKTQAASMEASVDKIRGWRAAETVAGDIGKVLTGTIQALKYDKVAEVSERMDTLFRQMILSEADNAIIRRATLTPQYDIVVEGPGDRTLNPDTELNGASRRALTVSFILALADVSGADAPNVIDTPLGMTSGPTREAVFAVSSQEASQLILFLTRSEIDGIEALLDEEVGAWQTLTAMAHYPTQVVNSSSELNEALRCPCSHRQFCDLCERVGDAANPTLSRRV